MRTSCAGHKPWSIFDKLTLEQLKATSCLEHSSYQEKNWSWQASDNNADSHYWWPKRKERKITPLTRSNAFQLSCGKGYGSASERILRNHCAVPQWKDFRGWPFKISFPYEDSWDGGGGGAVMPKGNEHSRPFQLLLEKIFSRIYAFIFQTSWILVVTSHGRGLAPAADDPVVQRSHSPWLSSALPRPIVSCGHSPTTVLIYYMHITQFRLSMLSGLTNDCKPPWKQKIAHTCAELLMIR